MPWKRTNFAARVSPGFGVAGEVVPDGSEAAVAVMLGGGEAVAGGFVLAVVGDSMAATGGMGLDGVGEVLVGIVSVGWEVPMQHRER